MMEVKKSQSNSNLLERIKIVKGENFVTIEDTKSLANQELIELITYLMGQSFIKNCKNVNILVNSKFNTEVDFTLIENGFKLHDENVTVHKLLDDSSKVENGFLLKDLNVLSLAEFKRVWEESMKGSLNSPSSLNVDEQMRSVELELGPNYKKSCIVAYDNGNPIGVIMPHIEPGTSEEGRLFYFGIIPSERGKGKSKLLHQQALEILKNDFMATHYIGRTGHNNLPMLKTFQNNGCTVIERNKVFKRGN
ncbi:MULTISPECIES: GNAT family N-acetyltransferase [unclassified Mesobacillus]|uniref:GNAT family N-acetyltransferase n=1 Tax=unclassified Mesobacillus TaxID=2675270 RepID=UPI002041C90C|nr:MULTISPECIES: GNAT family N-acetyltransferase [unclassified Mesobacillus]MCM3124502.1 GNAT family N-acetyltransferase [Mesobacillus sp. MER 33]MCM3234788.1 GNAT family N-acetyltransferase [Mesobacillus sp. MER 48]